MFAPLNIPGSADAIVSNQSLSLVSLSYVLVQPSAASEAFQDNFNYNASLFNCFTGAVGAISIRLVVQ